MKTEKIKTDILRIDEALDRKNYKEMSDLSVELVNTYDEVIEGIRHSVANMTKMTMEEPIFPGGKKRFQTIELPDEAIYNLKVIKGKLQLHNPIKTDDVIYQKDLISPITFNINNNNSNTQNTNIKVNVDVVFQNVIETVKSLELDSLLLAEVLVKIEELKIIVESTEEKKVKWEKAKNIGKWILDRTVDVGIAMLPLLLTI